jgi:hypothetical protein
MVRLRPHATLFRGKSASLKGTAPVLCKVLTRGFGILYLLTLLVFLIGTFGLFGQDRDPLSAVYLIILGQPWVQLAGMLPEAARPFGAALSPLVTLCLLWLICRHFARIVT